jgi:hypothetical protein
MALDHYRTEASAIEDEAAPTFLARQPLTSESPLRASIAVKSTASVKTMASTSMAVTRRGATAASSVMHQPLTFRAKIKSSGEIFFFILVLLA